MIEIPAEPARAEHDSRDAHPPSDRHRTVEPGMRRLDALVINAICVSVTGIASYLADRVFSLILEGRLVPFGPALETFLVGAHTVAPVTLGAFGWVVASAEHRVGRGGVATAAAYAAVAALAFGWLGESLASGAWVAKQPFAPAIPWVGAAAGFALGGGFGATDVRLGTHIAYRIVLGAGALAVAAANRLVLPGLYPDLHLTANLAQAALSMLLVRSLLREVKRIGLPIRAAAMVGFAVQVGSAGAWVFVPSSVKVDALAASPYVANVVPRLLPKPRLDRLTRELARTDDEQPWPFTAAAPPQWVADYNVVLIVVDALRADAVPPNRTGNEAFAKNGDTPFLDRWLAGGYQFQYAYTQSTNTKRSVPPLFFGTRAFEHPAMAGMSLAQAMKHNGRVPIAIVPESFVGSDNMATRALFDDFSHVEYYDEKQQERMVSKTANLLDRVQGKRLFAWIHLYGTHGPYYAGRVTTLADGGAPNRYRLALRWLDDQARRVLDLFDERSLTANTVFIFTSDHGEQISARRSGHGATVEEAETRTPLTVRVPGKPGGIVATVAGNIDIYPTALDLIGAEPVPEARGRSLVPQMAAPGQTEERPYFLLNGLGTQHGIVKRRQKLTYDSVGGVFARYDLDGGERQSLFREDSAIDSKLVSLLIRANPELASEELYQPLTRQLLALRLSEVKGTIVSSRLEFLLRTASLTRDEEVTLALDRLFDRATTDVRLAMVWYLGPSQGERWVRRLAATLPELDAAERDRAAATLDRRRPRAGAKPR